MPDFHVSPDPAHLAETAAQHFLWLGNEAIRSDGQFAAALSGGSTPKAVFELLHASEYASRINWHRVHLFWGDERCVPPNHADSNFRMAKETLLDYIPIPDENIHRMRGELDPQEAAAEYETGLKDFFGDEPHFDLIFLGMGTDGHTASLFPGTEAIQENERWVVSHYVEKLSAWRITLTPGIINQASNIIFLVSGKNKAQPLQRVLRGQYQPDLLPAQIVAPVQGNLTWLIDKAAARDLDS